MSGTAPGGQAGNSTAPVLAGHVWCSSCSEFIYLGNNSEAGCLKQHQGKAGCLKTQKAKRQAAEQSSSRARSRNVFQAFYAAKKSGPSNPPAPTGTIPSLSTPSNAFAQLLAASTAVAASPDAAAASTAVAAIPDAAAASYIVHATESSATAPPASVGALVARLEELVSLLPESICLGSQDDVLSTFACNPLSLTVQGDDEATWMSVNQHMDRVLLQGNRSLHRAELAALVRRGPLGMDGVCAFFSHFSSTLGSMRDALCPRLERFIESVQDCVPAEAMADKQEAPARSSDILPRAAECAESTDDTACARIADVKILQPCKGVRVAMPDGKMPHVLYPFTHHVKKGLNWDLHFLVDGTLRIQADDCGKAIQDGQSSCARCQALLSSASLAGIVKRAQIGVRKFSNHEYHGTDGLIELLREKSLDMQSQRLLKLTMSRKLLQRARTLDEHKKFVMAVSSGQVTRLHALVRTALRCKASIKRIVTLVDDAGRGVYKPKGYSEEEMLRGILFLRLAGEKTAELAHRSLGLPAVSTLRQSSHTRPFRVSASAPTVDDVIHNIDISCPPPPSTASHPNPPAVPCVLMLDELKITDCCRWDPTTNKILGICREHSEREQLVLDFETIKEAEAVCRALADDKVHFASEATVAALGLLTDDRHRYSARPILVSGTCKRESGIEHAKLVQTCLDACREKASQIGASVISAASDGEARRGSAFEHLFLRRLLSSSSPCYEFLKGLRLFDFRVGEGDITLDKDYKHVLKRLRNLLLRSAGILVDGVLITPALLERHLIDSGLRRDTVRAMLVPDDKQDVPTMYSLLRSVWTLPAADPSAKPDYAKTRAALRVYGRLCYYFSVPYVQISLSLAEQLEYLSAGVHLAIALFTRNGAAGKCMPSSLYLDLMHMVKNAIICVAKVKASNPYAHFWLILLGTDRLESAFGVLRSIVGNDTNCDALQLGSRLAHVSECANIFAQFPHWDRQPRRLRFAPMTETGEIVRDVDHISPHMWKGDTCVRTVVLKTCWDFGRSRIEREFESHDFKAQLASVEATPGADMLAPFGRHLDPTIDEDVEDLEDEWGDNGDELPTVQSLEMDLEDVVGAQLCDGTPISSSVEVGDQKAPVHKARALRQIIRYRALDSVDRMRRIAKMKRYPVGNATTTSRVIDDTTVLGAGSLCVNDPIMVLLLCQKKLFAAVGQTVMLLRDAASVQLLSSDILHDAAVTVKFQVLCLKDVSHDDSVAAEWIWSGRYEDQILTAPGRLIEPMDPAILVTSPGETTYSFRSDDLRLLAVSLFDQLAPEDLVHVPSIKMSSTFPYRSNGLACFVCEREGKDPQDALTERFCPRCDPLVELDWSNGPQVLQHMASHILCDRGIDRATEPCGFCLRPAPQCRFYLRRGKGAGSGFQVDMRKSSGCGRAVPFQYKAASTSKPSSPSSNVPIHCPLCSDSAPAVWKYNLAHHFAKAHPRAVTDNYKSLHELSGSEIAGVRTVWESRHPVRRPGNKPAQVELKISDDHRAIVPLGGLKPSPLAAASDSESDSEAEPAGDDTARLPAPLQPETFASLSGTLDEVSHGSSGTDQPDPEDVTASEPSTRRGKRARQALIRDACICGEQVSNAEINSRTNVIECKAKGCESQWYHLSCHDFTYAPQNWKCDSCKANEKPRKRHKGP